jgi:hypothetical protein
MKSDAAERFFVSVSARRVGDLRRLQVQGLDLFAPTARKKVGRSKQPFLIEGLLNTGDIERLKAAGYDVQVDAPMAERAVKAGDTLEFEPWLARMRAVTAKDGAVK